MHLKFRLSGLRNLVFFHEVATVNYMQTNFRKTARNKKKFQRHATGLTLKYTD